MRLLSGLLIIITFMAGLLCSCSSSRKAVASSSNSGDGFDYSEFLKSQHSLDSDTRALFKEAATWLGTPYKYGGDKKGVGADCSGFVMRVFLDVLEIKLPRTSAKMAEFCKKITKPRPGDLVFFATGKDKHRVSHVGIMLDEEHFIHTSSSKGVIVSSVTSPYYTRTFIKYGRVPTR